MDPTQNRVFWASKPRAALRRRRARLRPRACEAPCLETPLEILVESSRSSHSKNANAIANISANENENDSHDNHKNKYFNTDVHTHDHCM